MSAAPEPARLTNSAEVLLRQVHPSHLIDGEIIKEAFNVSKRDELKLSTLREVVGPAEAHRRWTEEEGYASIGTYGVTVHEVDTTRYRREADGNEVGLHAIDDATPQRPDHASVVFSDLSKGQRTQAARKLREHAVARGRLHP